MINEDYYVENMAIDHEKVTEESHNHHDEVDAMRYAMDFLNKYSDTPFTESVNSNAKYTIMMNVNKDKIKEYSATNRYLSHFRISPPYTNCTFLVDENAGIYHLDYDNDCEYAKESENLVRMKGYEIEEFTNCTLCESCEEWAEDAETEYESNYFFRR